MLIGGGARDEERDRGGSKQVSETEDFSGKRRDRERSEVAQG